MEKKKNLKNRVFAGLLALTLAGCKPALVKAEKSDVEYVTPTVIEYTGHENDYEYFEEEFMMYGCKETGLHAHVYEDENDIFFKDYSGHILQDDVLARLISMPNVLITSHQAFLTEEALDNIAKTTVNNITEFFNNNIVNEVTI